jgi:hypothetical protein
VTATDWTTPLLAAIDAAAADTGDIINELSAKLTARLAHEEADGLPLIDACLTPAQWQHYAQVRGERNLPDAPRHMAWLLSEAIPQTLDAVLGKSPRTCWRPTASSGHQPTPPCRSGPPSASRPSDGARSVIHEEVT